MTYDNSFISSTNNGLLWYGSYASDNTMHQAAQTSTKVMRSAAIEMCRHNLLSSLFMLLVKCCDADVVRQCTCQLQQQTQINEIIKHLCTYQRNVRYA